MSSVLLYFYNKSLGCGVASVSFLLQIYCWRTPLNGHGLLAMDKNCFPISKQLQIFASQQCVVAEKTLGEHARYPCVGARQDDRVLFQAWSIADQQLLCAMPGQPLMPTRETRAE